MKDFVLNLELQIRVGCLLCFLTSFDLKAAVNYIWSRFVVITAAKSFDGLNGSIVKDVYRFCRNELTR